MQEKTSNKLHIELVVDADELEYVVAEAVVKEMKAYDLVAVVRCINCVHASMLKEKGSDSFQLHCRAHDGAKVEPNDYCSRGVAHG